MIELLVRLFAGALSYLGKRRIEGSDADERLNRLTKIVELRGNMDKHGLTLDQVAEIENFLMQKPSRLRAIEDDVKIDLPRSAKTHHQIVNLAVKSAVALSAHRPNLEVKAYSDIETEFDQEWSNKLFSAQAVLKSVFEALEQKLSPSDYESVVRTQATWAQYADGQSALAASIAEGGTLRPVFYISELERLTVQRIAELKDFLAGGSS
ncbi:lysozyme inhibitor LprI family protein [Mesorhizobium loti]|uniref:lysozyme inhibitor LprI family protein n=1 Tax=Rhizobium loti TaxID=381 RepID=UPI00047B86DD|nr:lysozyme inhibitor LprI family protein [Mesorhizobium loti]